MIVRAARDLEAGTQLTWWYMVPGDGGQEDDALQRTWGFECGREMCHDSKTTSPEKLKTRKALLASIKDLVRSSSQRTTNKSADVVESKVAKLADTYSRPASEAPRLALFDAYQMLGYLYINKKQTSKAVNALLQAFKSLGYVIKGGSLPPHANRTGTSLTVERWGLVLDNLVDCWMILGDIFCREGGAPPALASAARMYAKVTYRIVMGEDETFEETYGGASSLA
jgi:hypothetical protein